jgi:hypothetical protein
MPSFSISIDGIDELKAKLTANAPKARQAVKVVLYQFAEEVMAASKETYVPVLTGALMNTGKVMPPVDSGDEVSVTLGYGDESVGYAIYVHENMIGFHSDIATHELQGSSTIHWTRPGSGPKYLEIPLKSVQDTLPGRIAKAYKEALTS